MSESLLPHSLLQHLARKKLVTRRAVASLGIGERRSKAKGPGLEFAEHRPYQPGDDIRYLDPYLEARLGQLYIKQFTLYQQLSVTILIDSSLSMGEGNPSKFVFAQKVAAGLAYAAVAGGDQVLLGTFSDQKIQWSPSFRGINRASEVFTWLQYQRVAGQNLLTELTQKAAPRLRRGGLLFVISDFLADGIEETLSVLGALGQELVGIQVLSPEELEPEHLGTGGIRLADIESGEEVEVVLDSNVFRQYQEYLQTWTGRLKTQFQRQQGLFLQLRSDQDIERIFLRDFQAGGLLR